MKNVMISVFVFACFFVLHPVFPHEAEQKATDEKDAATQDKKVAEKDDRFPDGKEHDFGKVAWGTYAKHAFRIVNTSDSPLVIERVRSWGAFKARVNKAELKPKEETKLVVLVETSRFVGPKTMSLFLQIKHDRGGLEEHRFWVTCNSDSNLKLDPKILLQNRLMEAACKGVSVERDGLPPSPGVYLGMPSHPIS